MKQFHFKFVRRSLVPGAAVATLLAGMAGGFATAESASATAAPLTVGIIVTASGNPSAPTFVDQSNAIKAAFAAQNAKGGVNGRKINWIVQDDTGTQSGNLAAAKSLVQEKHVIAIAEASPTTLGGASYLKSNGIPVVEVGIDPSIGSYSNFFIDSGGINPNQNVVSTTWGNIFKKIGATKVGANGYSVSSSSVAAAKGAVASAAKAGLKAGYLNVTLSAPTTNWTPYVLGFKNSNTNGYLGSTGLSSDLQFLTTASQQGLKLKALLSSGFSYTLTPAQLSSIQGDYAVAVFAPPELNTPATKAEQAILKKYDTSLKTPGGDFDVSRGYATGLLTIRGLQAAGTNPTSAKFLSGLHQVTGWTANGLLPKPVSFPVVAQQQKNNTQPPTDFAFGNCEWVLKIQGTSSAEKAFVPIQKTAFCGTIFKTS